MSAVTEKIKAGGDRTELIDWLTTHKYKTAHRYEDNTTGPADEADWDNLHVDGSWDEVTEAMWRGDLTHDEYYEIARRRKAAGV